ncbi:MAG: hypothetical protein JKY56_23565 [Kofleriaceae bacterium]|nr:hypothetical protein [Kofleriaceae bacterium]
MALSFTSLSSIAFSALLLACSGGGNGGGGNGTRTDANTGEQCVKVTETEANCANGIDDNCDGLIDCENIECSFDPSCSSQPLIDAGSSECGELSFGGEPLAIPDGNGTVYETLLNIGGFDPGQTLDTTDGFDSICVVMEHSWLRDLQIEMVCPSGEVMILQEFLGTTGGELFMGMPNDNDGTNPVPGVGTEYCWKADGINPPMLEWANANTGVGVLPAGDYRPNGSVDDLLGCTLNGEWGIRVIDDWASDNGYIFEWEISFSEDIIPDCLIIID